MRKFKSVAGMVVFCVIGLLFLVALGIFRLELGRSPGNAAGLPPLNLAGCTPAVDVPTGVTVNLGDMASFRSLAPPAIPAGGAPAPPAATATKATTPATAKAPASELTFITTGPFEVHVVGSLPAEGKDVPLAGQEIVLSKASPSFAMLLPAEAPALIQRGIAILKISGPARFGPADDIEYRVTVASDSALKAVVTGGKAIVPTGSVLAKVPLVTVQTVVTLQPLRARIWLENPVPTLTPMRVSGQPGLADLSIETGRSTLQIEQGGVATYACVHNADNKTLSSGWLPAGTTPQPAGSRNPGQVSIAIPSYSIPADTSLISPIWIAIGTSDGQKVAIGGVQLVGRIYAGGIGTLLTLVLLGSIMYARGQRVKDSQGKPRWFAGLFIGPDGDPSLSLLQVFIWTIITIWGFFYVFIVAGNLLVLTPEMMSLLGIAGVGAVLARWIAVAGGGSTSQPASTTLAAQLAGTTPATPSAQADSPSGTDFWRMLSTGGHFDLLKLQMFAFTVVIALYVVWRIADAAAFPALDTNTLLLLGVSQGVYVSSKLAGTTNLASLQATKAQLDLNAAAAKDLADKKTELDKQLATANTATPPDTKTADALKAPMGALDTQIADNKKEGDTLKAAYDSGLAKLGLKQA